MGTELLPVGFDSENANFITNLIGFCDFVPHIQVAAVRNGLA